ncbi:hypothetical protein OCT59_000488 [Rhizophagus irregularis]|nr:hypothetical protein OCT59_000488 [Rhizophagus irregularis]
MFRQVWIGGKVSAAISLDL